MLSRGKGTHFRAYLYWLLARYLDSDGSGRVNRKELKALAKSIGITPSQIKRAEKALLDSGFGKTDWTGKHYLLKSLLKAHIDFGCRRVGRASEVPLEFCANLHEFATHCWSAFLGGWRKKANEVPVSRATLKEISGIEPKTQYRYEKDAGVRVITNIAISKIIATKKEILALQEDYGRKVFGLNVGGQMVVAMQTPNIYFSPLSQAMHGTSRTIERHLRHLFNKPGRASNEIAEKPRMYFQSVEAVEEYIKDLDSIRGMFFANKQESLTIAGEWCKEWAIYDAFGPLGMKH